MQLTDPTGRVKELVKIRDDKYQKGELLRIGQYYSKFNNHQRDRFNRIVDSIARKYGLLKRNFPLEMLLIRQIALNTVKIEDAESYLLDNPDDRWGTDVEKWLLLMKKENRESLTSLATLVKITSKKSGVEKFDDLRNTLRDDEGLPKSKTIITPDGHDRRYHDDGVTRVAKT